MNLDSQHIEDSFFEQRMNTVITWPGSAGAFINTRGTVLLIDPVISLIEREGKSVAETGHRLKVPFPIEAKDVPRVDAVLYTHADGDHFGKQSAKILNSSLKPTFVATPPVQARLEEMGVERERIIVANDYDVIQIGQAEIMVTPALHDWSQKNPWKRGDCCGYLVKTPDGTIWHPGDTQLLDELLEINEVDLLFFDVAEARAHLGPEGSAKLAETCGATDLIAYHYGTFEVPQGGPFGSDPERCLPLLEGLSARFHLLNPGTLFCLPGKMVPTG